MGKVQTIDIGYMIGEYRFWKKEINRLEGIIYGGAYFSRTEGVAQYGIDAVMPKGSSIRSARELEQMDTREKYQYARLQKLWTYTQALEMAYDALGDEKLETIYDCLLDGMTYRQIAEYLATSKDYVRIKRKELVSQISQNSQIRTLLTSQKSVV